jgi:Family of unknown function (DUF6084)
MAEPTTKSGRRAVDEEVATAPPRAPIAGAIPELSFAVTGARPLEPAAVPTIEFELAIGGQAGIAVRSLMLNVQLQIAARRRGYDELAERRLVEVFGTPDRWGSTLGTLPWQRTSLVVPPFEEQTTVPFAVPLSLDLEVVASKYFYALSDGAVPLEFLFSGSVFYSGPDGRLQTTRLAWESEAEFELPVATWRAAIERHFPGAAWLRLDRESFDRLYEFKAERALPSWEAAIDALFEERRA